ncbi:BAG family molecular chaperone regulator 3-like [Andrographis paniculata]|uniref:BAG family molecular chaperone regulator 3-like n=1 Tax=Andrographis paniculata TaxID=175694 RepID=UPI0021E93CE2|nr:BAG family molecular chaperone regulator 3-like [Andrographis paniculata]
MMRMRTMTNNPSPPATGGRGGDKEWELRPGGMLVQKRTDSDPARAPPPTIRVRVKHGSIYHEISISSQATFGELKKMLSAPTGLHHEDQKIFFKDKEKDSKAFLDTSGVKDKSKVVLQEDPMSQEKRYLEMRKNAKMEKAAKSISEISLEVDRLAGRVSAIETVITKGGKVAEKDVVNLIELLMNQLLKLDGIVADGDVKLQRKMQVRRVQKYVEALDVLKVKNSSVVPTPAPSPGESSQRPKNSNGAAIAIPPLIEPSRHSNGSISSKQRQPSGAAPAPVIITTQWETFDAAPAAAAAAASTSAKNGGPSFTWDLL